MARIRTLARGEPRAGRLHAEASGSYRFIDTPNGLLLQIDTYGTDQRQEAGKVSQSLQFDSDGVELMRRIIAEYDAAR